MKIKSKSFKGFTWNIEVEKELSKQDIKFIENFSPTIYHNDLESYLWAFDTKLPSGRYIENMFFNNELTTCKALIL